MFESYSWPGAISLRAEIRVVIKWIRRWLLADVKDVKRALLEVK